MFVKMSNIYRKSSTLGFVDEMPMPSGEGLEPWLTQSLVNGPRELEDGKDQRGDEQADHHAHDHQHERLGDLRQNGDVLVQLARVEIGDPHHHLSEIAASLPG